MVLVSIVIPAKNEAGNVGILIRRIEHIFKNITDNYEIIVIDGHSTDATVHNAKKAGARVVVQTIPGFGGALKEGFAQSHGEYTLTIDGDLSHSPEFIVAMWKKRNDADIIIGSRYIDGGSANQPSLLRYSLSKFLNIFFSTFLSIPVKDTSSNFRIYRKKVLQNLTILCRDFDALQEILVRSQIKGYSMTEVPINYRPRIYGVSKLNLTLFGASYLKTLLRLWFVKNHLLKQGGAK